MCCIARYIKRNKKEKHLMSELEMRHELKTLIEEVMELDNFGDDDNFVTELGMDSVMALEMVARIEKRYRIRIPEERFTQMKTLNDVVRIVAEILPLVKS